MADLVITAANVKPSTGAKYKDAIAGVGLSAGDAIIIDANGLIQKADANTANASDAQVKGVMLNSPAAGQVGTYQYAGLIIIGAAVLKGFSYILSVNAGKICPIADYASGSFMTMIGPGASTTELDLSWLRASGYKAA